MVTVNGSLGATPSIFTVNSEIIDTIAFSARGEEGGEAAPTAEETESLDDTK